MRLLLLCGPAFSGKTTLACALEARGWLRISLDDILRSRGLEPGAGLPDRAWDDASFAACMLITSAGQRGLDVVVDDTLCYRFLRDRYREVGVGAGLVVSLAVLKISVAGVRERVAHNGHSRRRRSIEAATLESHLASFEWPSAGESPIELDATATLERQLASLTRAFDQAARESSSSKV